MDQVLPANPNAPKFIPVDIILEYADKDISINEAAKLLGITKQAYYHRLRQLNYTPKRIKAYNNAKTVLFDLIGSNICGVLLDNPLKLKELNGKNLIDSLHKINEMSRLERGLSTDNVDHNHAVVHVLQDRLNKISPTMPELDNIIDTQPIDIVDNDK